MLRVLKAAKNATLAGHAARVALSAVLLCLAPACASSGQYTWYSQLPRADWNPGSPEYVIGIGDTISVRVYEQDGLGGGGKIRNDGRMMFPLIGEVVVAGKPPSALAREMETRWKQFIVAPRVTINVEAAVPIKVTVLGEVKGAGVLELDPPANMLQAMARSGGLTDFADDSSIFVVRQFPRFQRIRFTYEAIQNNHGGAAMFPVRSGDLIVVE